MTPSSVRLLCRRGSRFILGLCLVLLSSCASSMASIDSPQAALQALEKSILPKIQIQTETVSDAVAVRYQVNPVELPLPKLEDFPHYGASSEEAGVYVEIFSSPEKANGDRENERWLIDVAEAFNQQAPQLPSGQPVHIGIRAIPSGQAARLLTSKTQQPAAYSPSSDLWLQLIEHQGIATTAIAPKLLTNTAGWVLPEAIYQKLAAKGDVTFDLLLNQIATQDIQVAYANPYSSSTALNLLHSLYWRAAGHQNTGSSLTLAELVSPQVSSVFDNFQSQVLITTPTTLDLQELFLRSQDKLQAFPLEYQNYLALKQLPGFEKTKFIPFGLPHNNPLVGFDWNTPQEQAALQQFAEFALSQPMQALAQQQGFTQAGLPALPEMPAVPSGEILEAVQSNWKLNKDGDRTVYLNLVIDSSGSMDGEPMAELKAALKVAAQQINPGNHIGLISFSDNPVRHLPLAAFDEAQHQRLLASIERLEANGGTALYDGVMVGLAELLEQQERDPEGRYYLMLLSDGKVSAGHSLAKVENIMAASNVRFYPIAYGDVDRKELERIASLRESTVQMGSPKNIQQLFTRLFQVNL